MLIPGQRYRPLDLLPHRAQMLLLDEIDDYGGDWLRAIVKIGEHSPFREAAGVPAWVGIEYMAQAAAAYGGVELLQTGRKVCIGLLLGTRRYEALPTHFRLGAVLQVSARLVLRDDADLAMFDCEIHEGPRKLAWADIKAYRPEDVERFLGT